MHLIHEVKGKDFKIESYTVDLVTAHIDELLDVDKVITGYHSTKSDAWQTQTTSGEDTWTLKNFTYPLPEKERLSFLVLQNNQAVAYMIASKYPNVSKSHLSRIAVLDSQQGFGIGSKLMQILEEQSRQLGLTEITLSTKYEGENSPVIHWYEKLGYKLLTTKEEVVAFLRDRNKPQDIEMFWPYNKPDNLVVMKKSL